MVRPPITRRLDHVDQLSKHGKLHLKLDRVRGALENLLKDKETDILHDKQGKVEGDDECVDEEQLPHDATSVSLSSDALNLENLANVEIGQGKLLAGKPGHLDLLYHLGGGKIRVEVSGGVAAELDGSGGHVEDGGRYEDSPQDETQKARIVEDQVEARVQDERLAEDHDDPSEVVDDSGGQLGPVGGAEVHDDETYGVGYKGE